MSSCNNNLKNSVAGARIGIYPMQDDFADIILSAVKESDHKGIYVRTDDLGTTVQGRLGRVFNYVKEVFCRAAYAGGHVTADVLFSVGCPGDVPEDFDFDVSINEKEDIPGSKIHTACAWSLYPLGNEEYFPIIIDEIERFKKEADVRVTASHYCTRIDGKAQDIFSLLESSMKRVCEKNSHTVIHALFSKGSPSKEGETIDTDEEKNDD